MAARGPGSARGSSVESRPGTGPPRADLPSPVAVRAARPRWHDPRLVLGLAVIAGCALVGARTLATADDTVAVWAARHPLTPGQPLSSGDLVRHEVRLGDQLDANRYLSADGGLPGAAAVDRPVGAGELLPRSALGEVDTGPLTEVPLSVDTAAVPATVRVGSTIDVWVTPPAPAAGPRGDDSSVRRSRLVFDDVRVVSAPVAGSSLGPTTTRQIVVGVPADHGAALPRSIAALGSGDLMLTEQR